MGYGCPLLSGSLFLARPAAGKRAGRRWVIGQLSAGGDLIHLQDSTSGLQFLVDTGSSRSVYPHQSSAQPSGPQLITAGGTPVPAWGVRNFTLSFASRKFTFPFILGQVSYPILSNDFLAAHHLIVDPARRHVIHEPSHTVLSHPSSPSPSSPPSPFLSNLDSYPSSIRQLLTHYPTVFSTDLHAHPPQHGVFHHIETTGPPVFAKARRLDPIRLQQAQREFDKLEQAGIIHRSNSPWSSPLHLVPKPDGSLRFLAAVW